MADRGQCSTCGYRYRCRKDGTLQAHHLYTGSERQPECEGSGKPPKPYDPNECVECMAYYHGTPMLMEAIWSVAIESPKSGDQLAWEFLETFHAGGHKDGEDSQ